MTWVSNVGRTRSQCDYERSAIQEVVILSEIVMYKNKTRHSDEPSCTEKTGWHAPILKHSFHCLGMKDILDSFKETEFSYMEQKSMSRSSSRATSFRKVPSRKDDKWWLPVPWIPSSGLSERSRKHLRHQRDCGNQIHKAAMAINNNVLNEMEVPESYIADLPKWENMLGRCNIQAHVQCRCVLPEQLLDTIKIASEHEALELADKVEASMYTWRRKAGGMAHSKSWNVMKDLVYEADRNDKNHVLAERAKTLLFCLKHRYPELSQTTLDTCKILHNRDVGQAILESYSRVLEGFAFNLVSWIDDVLDADQSMRSGDDD
ncbi:hypothetical protein V2J09_004502 [Rumex salicifolius]